MRKIFILLLMALTIGMNIVVGQNSKGKKPATKPKTTTTKPQQKKPAAGKQPAGMKAGTIPATEIDTFKQQVIPLVNFFVSTLNFLADPRNPVNEKQTVITQSYLKFTWDPEVQVEDDLDETRLVPLYKDMPAYLTDVSFFFKGAKFKYTVQDVNVLANELGNTYFRVTANRNLKGITLNGDSVNSNKVRYVEVNYDETKQQLKIVSVYTTKLNEKDDLRNWWNGLSMDWKEALSAGMMLEGTLPMAQIESFNDSVAMVGGQKTAIMGSEFYKFLGEIMQLTRVNLAGNQSISNLEPLGKISALRDVNISGTPVSDLMPLRNLNNLQKLDLSNTLVTSLEPLRYCTQLQELKMKGTDIDDLSVLPTFTALTSLDISGTNVTLLDQLSDLTGMKDLRLSHTGVKDLSPISNMRQMELLNISVTRVENLDALKNMSALKILLSDSTAVKSLVPLDNLTGLQKVYFDNSKITQSEALNFLKKHPGVSLVYKSAELARWWAGINTEWQNLFNFYLPISNPPTSEQLHKLVLLDSINITGRMSVTTLEPLRELILLRNLQCQNTGLSALDPLAGLTELKVVNASGTKVSNLAPLKGLLQLELLNLDNDPVVELDPLFGLDKLRMVYADNSQVGLAEANAFFDKNPECMLVFQTYENNRWWTSLSQAWKDVLMQQINAKGTPDKVQLQQIANIPSLDIAENFQISDLMPLQHLSRLTELGFSGTSVSKLDPVTKMTQLKALRCPKNPITDITPLTGMPNLTEIDISNTQVEELVPLQNMMQIEILKFSGTPVKNLKYIMKLTNMRVLEFYNTRVSSLDALEGMKKLETLKIFRTNVKAKKVEAFKATHPRCEVVFY